MASFSSPDHYVSIGGNTFVDRVRELSDGRIIIDHHQAAVLGDWIPVYEEVMKGTIEFSITSYNTIHDPRLNIVWIPYAVTNWDEVKASYSPGGWIFATAGLHMQELSTRTITMQDKIDYS